MKTIKSHIFRRSDSYELFCGVEYVKSTHAADCALRVSGGQEVCNCRVVEACQDCLDVKKSESDRQVVAARKAIEARNERHAQFDNDFEIFD